ncbi:metapyrocatechase [Paraburkholderia sp. RP-4-7]|uniref:Metapyrocatechase n=1 Tax=Paraburkholderia polaris TaxID=2728848 RepID=A0A848IQS9_9BURK|nr:VOC family protein [Paraburkholderia polaris]NMM04091.1 metapyrocatechase [Paraburkholderia polaris]
MSNDAPTRHAAVHSIDHFALNVPSIADARHFYSAFGLDVRDAGDGPEAHLELRAGDGHRWARILPAASKSLAYLSFSCFEGDLETLERQVREAGGRVCADAATPGHGWQHTTEGLWFVDPDGNMIHVGVGPKTTPTCKTPFDRPEVGPDSRGSHPRSQARTVRPRRMSHVLLFTQDTLRAVDFYQRALGLRLSDRSADIIAFMHGPHGSDHHLVAFVKSSAKGWHHVAWDVDGIDEVGAGSSQMAAAGYTRGWGTGRHVLGSNYFHYVMDPWGSFSEFSADIDFVTAGVGWPAGDFAPEDSLYLWGPEVPPYFIHNTEA